MKTKKGFNSSSLPSVDESGVIAVTNKIVMDKKKRMKLFDKLSIIGIILSVVCFYSMVTFFVIGNTLVGWLLVLSYFILLIFILVCTDNATPLTKEQMERMKNTTLDDFLGY
jgi:purine-cytosine permease-like protein